MRLTMRAARGVANRAREVAVVGYFDQRETGVLLVVRAEPAIVRATVADGRVVAVRLLRRLQEDLAAPLVIVHVVRDEDPLPAVDRASLLEIDVALLEENLPLDFPKATRADRDRDIVEDVRPYLIGHGPLPDRRTWWRPTPPGWGDEWAIGTRSTPATPNPGDRPAGSRSTRNRVSAPASAGPARPETRGRRKGNRGRSIRP